MGNTATVGIRIPLSDGFYINPFSGIRDGRRFVGLFKEEHNEGYAPYYGVTVGYTL